MATVPAPGETASAYRAVGANRSLRRVLLAFLVFNAAEQAVWIAVTIFAFNEGGTTTAGIVAVAQLVPAMLFAPLASVLGDRMRRDRALALGYAVQGVTFLVLAGVLVSGPPLAVYAVAVVGALAVTLTRPVHHAVLPELAESPGQLTAANSVSSTVEGLGLMIGPLLNSLLIVLWGPAAVCAVFAVAILGTVPLCLGLRLRAVDDAAAPADVEKLAEGLLHGVNELRYDPPAGVLTFIGGGQFFLVGLLDVLVVMLAIDVLAVGESGAGILTAGMGVGGMIGAAVTAVLVRRTRLVGPIELGVLLSGTALVGVAGASALGPAVVLLALVGASRSFFDVAARTLLQRSVRGDIVARIFGLQEALIMGALAAGSAAAPILVHRFGEQGAFVAAGVAVVLSGVVAYPFIRRLDTRADLPDPSRVALLRSMPPFAPLPEFSIERAARALLPSTVPAGSVVFSQGERGDRFYAIATGEVSVEHDGQQLARLGPGGYFGEIALLRSMPRTATVRALSDLELLALPRRDFLGAVTGDRPSSQAANREIDRRLREQGVEE
jgi:MFS family permease